VRNRGFSLVEALFTALLVSLALGIVGTVAHQFQRAMTRSAASDSGLEALLEIRRLAAELEQATSISSPGLSATSTLLRFQRIDPSSPGRIPAVLLPTPDPIPAAWEPRDPAYLVTVSYSLNAAQQLVRRVDFPGGSFEQQTCADHLVNFQAQHPNRGTIALVATVSLGEQTRSLNLVVNLHAIPAELTP